MANNTIAYSIKKRVTSNLEDRGKDVSPRQLLEIFTTITKNSMNYQSLMNKVSDEGGDKMQQILSAIEYNGNRGEADDILFLLREYRLERVEKLLGALGVNFKKYEKEAA